MTGMSWGYASKAKRWKSWKQHPWRPSAITLHKRGIKLEWRPGAHDQRSHDRAASATSNKKITLKEIKF